MYLVGIALETKHFTLSQNPKRLAWKRKQRREDVWFLVSLFSGRDFIFLFCGSCFQFFKGRKKYYWDSAYHILWGSMLLFGSFPIHSSSLPSFSYPSIHHPLHKIIKLLYSMYNFLLGIYYIIYCNSINAP